MSKQFSFINTYIGLIKAGMSPSEAYDETNRLNPQNVKTGADFLTHQRALRGQKRLKVTSDTRKPFKASEIALRAKGYK